MSVGDTVVGSPLSISGDDTKVVVRGHTVLNGFKVCDTTNRNLISAEAKLGGFAVYNTTTSQLERWDGAAWVSFGGGSGGGGMGFRYTFSATTTDADPGAGTLRISTASYASAGSYTLFVDLAEYGGTDVTAWLDSFDDANGGVKGILRLQSVADPTKWVEILITAWTTASGYRKLSGTYLAGPGGLSTTAGDTFLSFDAIGYTGTVPDANLAVSYIKADGTRAFSGDQSLGSHKLTNLTNGATGTQDAATVAQTEALIAASVVGPTLPIVNEATAARTLTAADAGKLIRCAVTCTITINSGVFAAGDVVAIRQVGGMVTLAGSCSVLPPAPKVNTTAFAGATIGVTFLSGSTAESMGELSDA